MAMNESRRCPLCDGKGNSPAFPYATNFNNAQFNYIKCGACLSVFVDPVPDRQTFEKMYAKTEYHDVYYENIEDSAYSESAKLLREYLPAGATVLDYGCGVGAFLKQLAQEGFITYGVEFDIDAALFAGLKTNCETFSIDQLWH